MVFGHGFITVEGQKMSKTVGNVLDPIYLVDKYGADAVRYFLFEANTFDQDGDFSRKDMISKVNSHLANGLGNLLNRAVTLLQNNFDSKIPEATIDLTMLSTLLESSKKYHAYMSELEFSKAVKVIFEGIVDPANKYMNDKKPWTLFKEGKKEEGGAVLATVMAMLKRAAILLLPFTPGLSHDIWQQLGFDTPIEAVNVENDGYNKVDLAGQLVRNLGPVFKRIEDEESDGGEPPAQGAKKKRTRRAMHGVAPTRRQK
jgi:methionyl-tRNA synthetase